MFAQFVAATIERATAHGERVGRVVREASHEVGVVPSASRKPAATSSTIDAQP